VTQFTEEKAEGAVMNTKQRNRGFTLIELVVVIAILAILAAFALPRFAQLSEQAHRSNVKALAASVALVKAQWVTNGFTAATDDVEGFGEDDVDVSDEGWAVSTDGANAPANLTDTRCINLWGALLQSNAPTVGTATTDEYAASANRTSCEYTYQEDGLTGTNARQIIYDADTGEVTTNNVD
jgi:prepilin-type N-terminal cleavage/methylation domain-containing protein